MTVSPEKATPRPMDAKALEALAERAYREGYADGEVAREFGSHDPDNEWRTSDTRAYLAALPAPAGAVEARPTGDATERLQLTEYEIQVLLGTSIHGCNMSPDRVFSLPMAWHRLYAIGLIDRPDGLAIITEKGRGVVDRIGAMLASAPASPAIGVQAVTDKEFVASALTSAAELIMDMLYAARTGRNVPVIAAEETAITLREIATQLSALHPAPEAARRLAEAVRTALADEMFKAVMVPASLIELDNALDGFDAATPSDTAPSPKVSDGVREALTAWRLREWMAAQGWHASLEAVDLALAALSQEHAPGRKESR